MFDRAWIETELAGIEAQLAQTIVLLHQLEGAKQVLEQMRDQLNSSGAEESAPLLDDVLAGAGLTVEEIIPMSLAGAQEFEVHIPKDEQNAD